MSVSLLLQAIPQIPLVLRTAVGHTLGWTEMSWKWDLKMELTVRVIQSIMRDPNRPPRPMSETQTSSLGDSSVKGQMWISQYTTPKPAEDDARQHVFAAIDALKEGDEDYTKPTLEEVYAEWTGFRKDAGPYDVEPEGLNEVEKYKKMMEEVTSDVVVLYFHGGAYYLMDPATHRHVTSRLAQITGGRAYSVRYRLSPQGAFPAALVDAFISYLSLLHPPPGAPHAPVAADKIVISGDSAGGNLSAALLQLLLQLHRSAAGEIPTVKFHGAEVKVPLPAGVALNSPWCDMTSCLDSFQRNATYDYLPNSWNPDAIPTCPIWPAKPPRADIFAEGSALAHQLVSPVAAKSWKGSPPVFYMWGDELLTDEGGVMASRMVKDGVTIIAEHFEAMPHCFALLFGDTATGKRCFDAWGQFCTDVVKKNPLKTKGTYITAKILEERDFYVDQLMENLGLDETKLKEKMGARRAKVVKEFEEREERRLAKEKAETA
jgi:acetyl esterase/lipase